MTEALRQHHRAAHRSVLLIDDQCDACLPLVTRAFQPLGLSVECARTATEGVVAATTHGPFAFVLIDWQLGGDNGCEVLRCLRPALSNVPLIVFSGFVTDDVKDAAIKLGADDVVEKTMDQTVLRDLAHRLLQQQESAHLSPADRWAREIWRTCGADEDPRTMDLWAHAVGTNVTSLCERSRRLGVSPKRARDLARVLRALRRSRLGGRGLEFFLEIGDDRTLRVLFRRGGIEPRHSAPLLDEFLQQQTFIPAGHDTVAALRQLAAAELTPCHACHTPCC
jgi:ActR/RegA family two-component response regulator